MIIDVTVWFNFVFLMYSMPLLQILELVTEFTFCVYICIDLLKTSYCLKSAKLNLWVYNIFWTRRALHLH